MDVGRSDLPFQLRRRGRGERGKGLGLELAGKWKGKIRLFATASDNSGK